MIEDNNVRHSVLRDLPIGAPQELHFPSLDPKMTLYQAELERRQAVVDLGVNRIVFKGQQIKSQLRWDDLTEEKEKLREMFVASNKVVKENKASISRFREIMREHKGHKERLKHEILSTQNDIREYKDVQEIMETYVSQYTIFENFLEKVASVSTTGDLINVGEILNRYETLEGTRAHLARILAAEMEAEAQLRKQMIELLEKESSELKRLNNRLVMLQVTRRQALDRRIYWEMMVNRIKSMILARQEESIVLREACWDLYDQICRRRKVMQPTVPTDDLKSQLDYIQKSIMFYKEVLTMATGGGRNKGAVAQKKKKK